MKYAIVRQDGVIEIRQDSSTFVENAFLLTDEQYAQLIDGKYIFKNGEIVVNPDQDKLA